jgi:GNAT superfamily N-acetyltransferase
MHEALTDLSEAGLANAVKSNFFAFFAQLEHLPGVELARLPALTRWRTAILHPLFQGVLVTGAAAGDEERLVHESCDHFARHNTGGFCWWFSPDADPAPWMDALQAHGFTPDDDPPGMAVVMDELRAPGCPLGVPAQVQVVPVADAETLRVWCQVFGSGYELPPEMAGQFADLIMAMGLQGGLQHYLAYQNGIPVAASSLWLAAGVAGIYNVATIPEARRQGIGAAVTIAPLQAARALGYRAGVLQSSQAGFGVYQQLGFRHVCAMDHYVWTPTSLSERFP